MLNKIFCIYNADGSFEEKDLKQMLINCEKNDFVFASRYLRGVAVMMIQLLHMFGNKFFSLVGRLLFSLNLTIFCIHM